jgi:hypothetical protein
MNLTGAAWAGILSRIVDLPEVSSFAVPAGAYAPGLCR